MGIKFKLKDLQAMVKYVENEDALKREGLTTLTQYKLSKLVKLAMNELEPLAIVEENLLEKYGDKDKEGKLRIIDGNVYIPNKNEYNKEFREILNAECEIDFEPIKFECFENTEFNGEDFLIFGGAILD